ncbi:MAG: type I-C CRISPR-associated protein Cas5c [Propionibacteriaceae bacterium]|jgi:CRISPR-associated protein Cas5d|nr:type I-C CRISPR-associated protein Cas5c [Propionibacteriaceae bacterium]
MVKQAGSLPANHHEWSRVPLPEFHENPVVVQASGPWACFTQPQFNSERVSYPIMTPSAAQGLLSAVFWKPQFKWVIEAIEVLAPVKWATLRRNESGLPITADALKRGYLDVNTVVQQRMTLMLRDVHYRVYAHVWVHPEAEEQSPAKWRDQFRRRIARGQTFSTPFFGMREFHADIQPADHRPPIPWSEDLGIMLLRIDQSGPTESSHWFDAQVINGRMDVPRRGRHKVEG